MKDYFINLNLVDIIKYWNAIDEFDRYNTDMLLLKRIEEAYKNIPRFPNVVKRLGVL